MKNQIEVHNATAYQQLALRTESPVTPELIERLTGNVRAVHAFFGLLTETGELADGFKRTIFYGKPLDTTNIKEEVGDVFWYLAILCDFLGIDFLSCMSANIKKLSTRYPDKYSHEAALNRNLEAERKALLEGNTDLIAEVLEERGYSLPLNAPTLGELLNKDSGSLDRFIHKYELEVKGNNGFDCAREIASWMDGQTRERALKHIQTREQQYKESLEMTPAEKDEKEGNDTLNSIRRSTQC